MLLNEIAFNEVRNVPDYITYLCRYASKVSTKASGSCFDRNTRYLEATYFYLQKELGLKSLKEVSEYVKEVTGLEVSEGWMSPLFMEMFNYYYLEELDE